MAVKWFRQNAVGPLVWESEAIVLSWTMNWSGCDRRKDHGPCIGQVVIAVGSRFGTQCWSGGDRRKDHGPCSGRVVIAVRITSHVLVRL